MQTQRKPKRGRQLLRWPQNIPVSWYPCPRRNHFPWEQAKPSGFLLTKEHGNVKNRMSLPWLDDKRAWLLCCYQMFSSPFQFACSDDKNCHEGETHVQRTEGCPPDNSEQGTETVSTISHRGTECCQQPLDKLPKSRLQMRLQTLSQLLDCSLVRETKAEDPAKSC